MNMTEYKDLCLPIEKPSLTFATLISHYLVMERKLILFTQKTELRVQKSKMVKK